MQQYLDLKEKYKDCILMMRLGDFYEMFFEDAELASSKLGIVLTARDCGLEHRAPMCGVPYHSVDGYINKLIKQGYKVALCEQLTEPKAGKGLVERDVVRVFTPGTVIEESMLDNKANSFITSVSFLGGVFGIAYCDISTGDFHAFELIGNYAADQLLDELARIHPREIIVNKAAQQYVYDTNILVQVIADSHFVYSTAYRCLTEHFGVATLSGFGFDNAGNAGINAAGALLYYLEDTQKNALKHILKLTPYERKQYVIMDKATRQNLELTRPLRYDGNKAHTLFGHMDYTNTSMGGRLLRTCIEQPLTDAKAINKRLDATQELMDNVIVRDNLKRSLSKICDIERLCSKIAYGTINPKECLSIARSLAVFPDIYDAIASLRSKPIVSIAKRFDTLSDIYELLSKAICDDPSTTLKEGGIIRKGYSSEVDELRYISENGRDWVIKLEAEERESSGIKNLKFKYNRIFGYYAEVSKSYSGVIPYYYERKQTVANAERYTFPALKELEEKILGAEEKCMALEYNLFIGIRNTLISCVERLKDMSGIIAAIDIYCSLATLAAKYNYVRPSINDNNIISIKGGRHPIVEASRQCDGFVSNDTEMDEADNRLLIITGPNMAGKSTYMRQTALIVLMAHMGSFVPASRADICIVDRVFTRIGASDSLSTGQSTFMVEMSEVANILNNATSRSLIVFDEIGRGTSTFDGLSIAWSVLEYTSSITRSKTLFATHYHELTELEGVLQGVKNYRVAVKESEDNIIFLRKIVRGSADKSFGIQVAKLAGLPGRVLKRAKEILTRLEQSDINSNAMDAQFEIAAISDDQRIGEKLMARLESVDPNRITPIEAMILIHELCGITKEQ